MIGFIPFCTDVVGYTFTPAQRVLMAVGVDGVQPRDLEGEDRELARTLFGDVEEVPEAVRRVIVAVLGRSSGKDDLGALYGLWRMLTADCSGAGPGDVPTFIIVAPDTKLSGIAMKRAKARARSVPSIAALIASETADGFTLRRPDGYTVSLEVLAASRGGSAVRGRSLLGALLTECAFFRDADSGVVNDADIFAALLPRLMRGGAILLFSTPWTQQGLLWALYEKNFGQPHTAIVAKASTIVMRGDDPDIRQIWDLEHERDPANADRELGANFRPHGSALSVFAPNWVADASKPPPENTRVIRHYATWFAADWALGGEEGREATGDDRCFAEVFWSDEVTEDTPESLPPAPDGSRWLFEVPPKVSTEWVQEDAEPWGLKPVRHVHRQTRAGNWFEMSEGAPVPKRVLNIANIWAVPRELDTEGGLAFLADEVLRPRQRGFEMHTARTVVMDQWEYGATSVVLKRHGVRPVKMGWSAPSKARAVDRLSSLFRDRQIRIPNNAVLKQQLLEYSQRLNSGGSVVFGGKGRRDDHAQVIVTIAMTLVHLRVAEGDPFRELNVRTEVQ